jgi:hypothetical protein
MRTRTAAVAISVIAGAAVAPYAGASAAKAPKPPKAGEVTLTSSAPIITFGQKDTLSGQLKGGKAAGVTVQLQQQPAPFTGAFKNVAGGSATTDGQGKFSFTVQPQLSTKYRAVAKASPTVTSPELTLPVRFKVTLRLSDYTPARGARVRFSGTTVPAHDGATVYIQRRTSTGGYRTVSRAVLHHTGGNFSTYSKRIRVRANGVFRARVRGDAQHATGTSRAKHARVH